MNSCLYETTCGMCDSEQTYAMCWGCKLNHRYAGRTELNDENRVYRKDRRNQHEIK